MLASRHRLILMTKGDQAEQADKLQRSGVQQFFSAVEIPHEKNPAAYQAVCRKYELARGSTWMVGNSPRSDINPALAAGLHAVFVRHPNTWILEREEIAPAPVGQRLIEIESFAALADSFVLAG